MCQHCSSPYLTTREAAAYLRLEWRTLANMRTNKTGPRYTRHGGRVMYRIEDLKAWSDAARRRPTGERDE